MDVRMEFITRVNKGERLSDLCGEYGISQKTGRKFRNRYDEQGVTGLLDQTRAPKHIPHRTPVEMVKLVVAERRKHPTWGPKKLKAVLEARLNRPLPSASTLGNILVRERLIEPRTRHRARHRSQGTWLRPAEAPNDVWCIDYKGQFRLGDQSYCYPLTVTDHFSRYIVGCEGMAAINEEQACDVMTRLFREYGLPAAIRSDNGPPFASTGLMGLTKLSVYWMKLGIAIERSRPAHPQDNGRHERMHRTLKQETTRPACGNLLKQQEAFDRFVEQFNDERPHEALAMKPPGSLYVPSTRRYPEELPQFDYSSYDDVIKVHRGGTIQLSRRKAIRLTSALVGQFVAIREEDDGRWLVSFLDLDLGHIGKDNRLTPAIPHPQLHR
jgi:transposase InsO family protein